MKQISSDFPIGMSVIEGNHEYKIDSFDVQKQEYKCHTVEWRAGVPEDKPGSFTKTIKEVEKDLSKFFKEDFVIRKDISMAEKDEKILDTVKEVASDVVDAVVAEAEVLKDNYAALDQELTSGAVGEAFSEFGQNVKDQKLKTSKETITEDSSSFKDKLTDVVDTAVAGAEVLKDNYAALDQELTSGAIGEAFSEFGQNVKDQKLKTPRETVSEGPLNAAKDKLMDVVDTAVAGAKVLGNNYAELGAVTADLIKENIPKQKPVFTRASMKKDLTEKKAAEKSAPVKSAPIKSNDLSL